MLTIHSKVQLLKPKDIKTSPL